MGLLSILTCLTLVNPEAVVSLAAIQIKSLRRKVTNLSTYNLAGYEPQFGSPYSDKALHLLKLFSESSSFSCLFLNWQRTLWEMHCKSYMTSLTFLIRLDWIIRYIFADFYRFSCCYQKDDDFNCLVCHYQSKAGLVCTCCLSLTLTYTYIFTYFMLLCLWDNL